ncbi:ATP-dependent zinc metalloprotease FtsH [Thiohalomonas denitrificans]|uniref:ATP-dependent zinc metalloprotease FtsH n=1 Tax=Thiohalomonas denitrificans TaxID=415747 RepID=UPI0026F25250|nr:ATP-dependent zinc metalloprotease FtsH [Thiohalomonas denitrificans]
MADNNQRQEILKWAPILLWVALALLLFALFSVPPAEPRTEITYTQFRGLVEKGAVERVLLQGRRVEGELRQPAELGPGETTGTTFSTRIPEFGAEELLTQLEARDIAIEVEPPEEERLLTRLLIVLVPWLLFIGLLVWFFRRTARQMGQLGPGGGEMKRFLERSTERAEIPKVSFSDVAGQEAAKREVRELVEYLKEPDKFRRLGAEIPRGILLMGPPGTGKTLLARALAGEAGVPFYTISASEFIEVFVGVGASRVRNLFAAAKKNAPSIIFIDELDSIGRTRGTGLGGGHDEREQTLNQILAELDGFTGREATLVLAATNRPDVLDPALLRPGRFDRHVNLDLPDREARLAILKLHAAKVPLAPGVDLEQVAGGTPGFAGADLKNLVNESAILAAREGSENVDLRHFDEARDRVMMGAERQLIFQPEERRRLAFHEAGHALVAHFLPNTDPLYKVSIVPRGHALGGTHQLPEHERYTFPEEYLRDRLAVTLAGRSAERLMLGTISSGADDDIRQATKLARSMVSRWGMSDEVGPVDLRESEEHPFLGREIAQPRRYSEQSAENVDRAVRKILLESEKRAQDTLENHRDALKRLAAELEEKETVWADEVRRCLEGGR